MYRKVLNYLRGQVTVEVESAAPERVLNLCAAHGIPFWELEWLSEIRLRAVTARSQLPRLREVLTRTDAALTVVRTEGAPEVWRQYRRRYVLLAAALLLAAVLALGSTHIWAFQVTGNDTVPTETILRTLEKHGVALGARSRIDQEALRNQVLLELPDVVWLTVNMRGCTAHVQVVERQRPPHLYADGEIANVVAARDGLVTRIQALDGQAQVMAGSTVTAGQVLISGVVDSDQRGYRLLRGMGQVWARTWYELSVSVPLTVQEKGQETEAVTRMAVDIGRNRIKIYGKGSMTDPDCDKMTVYRTARLPFGLTLPVTLVTERTVRHAVNETERPVAAACAEGEAQLMTQLQAALEQTGGQLLHHRFDAVRQGTRLVVTLHAECEEQIGVSSPLDIQDMGR